MSVVAKKDDGLGGQELTTPITRVLVATAVMAVATVLALNVSAADSGLALLGRVALAVVVGALAFGGTTVVLASREARRVGDERAARAAERPEPIGPPPALSMDGPGPAGTGPDGPRQRAAHSSIRLITPDGTPDPLPADPGDGTSSEESSGEPDDPSPMPFRGRLDERSDRLAKRHLRPVPGGRQSDPADGRSGRPDADGRHGGRGAPGRRGGTPWPGSGW